VQFIPETVCTAYPTEFFFQVRESANDTKVYIGNYNDNTQVEEGSIWKWRNIYKLDLAGASASASASVVCSNEYTVNERAAAYVITDVENAERTDIYDGTTKLCEATLTEDGYFFG
jgi:hypothetical protein